MGGAGGYRCRADWQSAAGCQPAPQSGGKNSDDARGAIFDIFAHTGLTSLFLAACLNNLVKNDARIDGLRHWFLVHRVRVYRAEDSTLAFPVVIGVGLMSKARLARRKKRYFGSVRCVRC